MPTSSTARLFLLATLTALSGTLSATANSIGVAFGTGGGTLTQTDIVGVVPYAQSHYNSVSSAAFNRILNDVNGNPTTAALTTNGATFNRLSGGSSPGGPEELLNNNCAGNFDTTWSFTIDNIPFASYTMIIYCQDLGGNPNLSIQLGITNYYYKSLNDTSPGLIDNDPATPYIYTRITSTNPASPTTGNYIQSDGLTGGSQTVTVSSDSFVSRHVGGFQIVQTPEPGTCALLIGAFGALGMRRYRGRKG